MTTDIAVLVIAYRRQENIKKILEICAHNKVSKIFIALDGAKHGSLSGLRDNLEIQKVVDDFEKIYVGEVKKLYHETNIGCAASVMSACDWAFSLADNLIILEDDCIPTDDFFKFSKLSLDEMRINSKIWLSCGTQFAPQNLTNYSWVLSKYALTWGWCTNRTNWNQISMAIKEKLKLKRKHYNLASLQERVYWNEGSRRAHEGWTDVWDTILVKQMVSKSKYAILPYISLVTNLGDDDFATNTIGDSEWLNLQTGYFPNNPGALIHSKVHDEWLRNKFYRISLRHIFSTQFTKMHDLIHRKKIPRDPLVQRWEQANTIN